MKIYRHLLAALLVFGWIANAGAVCDQSGASQADRRVPARRRSALMVASRRRCTGLPR